MNSSRPGFIESQPISQALLQTIRKIGEHEAERIWLTWLVLKGLSSTSLDFATIF